MTTFLSKYKSDILFVVHVFLSSLLMGVSAHVKFFLPFSPVPVTAQTFVLPLLAFALGKNAAVSSILAYFAQGLVGLPVFAVFSGPAVFLSPSAGYLYGFLAASFVLGSYADKRKSASPLKTFFVLTLGNTLIYGFGLAWLSFFIPNENSISVGLLPFLPGELVKMMAALSLIEGVSFIRNRKAR